MSKTPPQQTCLDAALQSDPSAWLSALPSGFDRAGIEAQWWALVDAATVARGELPEVSTTTLAEMLGFSPQYTAELVKEGVLVKTGRGRFVIRDSVRNFVSKLKGERKAGGANGGGYEADKARKMKADADLAEIEVAKAAGKLIEERTQGRTWANAIVTTKSKLLALAPRLGPQTVIAASAKDATDLIEREMRSALEELTLAGVPDDESEEPTATNE